MKKVVLNLVVMLALSGCCSIFKGSDQTVNIATSNNKQVPAVVYTENGQQNVILPQAVSVSRSSSDMTINVKENKCVKESRTIVESKVQPAFWGNVISGGLLGSATDAMTGSMWKYDDNITVVVDEKDVCKAS